MREDALAPSSHHAGQQPPSSQNPFASPGASPIQQPKPCAQRPQNLTAARHEAAHGQWNTAHDQSPRRTPPHDPSKAHSMSSSDSTHMSSFDLEKSSIAQEQAPPARRTERDPEKAARSSRRSTQRQANMGDSLSLTYSDDDYDEDDGRRTQEKKAVQILAYLAAPCVVLSFLNCFWAIISIILTLFTQPVRLCARRPSFGQQLGGLLGPALNLQLKSIYTPLKPHANEDMSYHSFALVMVHILSPFLSFVLMFVAWVLAAYWLVSAAVGDPAGMDKRDDGRESVLSLRGWWEYWLMRCVRDE
ncbi:hypothetical protein KC363_g1267 [Hortaea werneckii]|uniref:Uncharacterized protein n=1 Tax=Hortaea werneckii TaxID=91943 RepID=A0A3M7F5Y9_HORWE|nr:hypothetical protein KC361_g2873 [Hortaea werneckii]KAI6885205.1 hypothetical protein KC325_g3724 [Hortaea werneckii]KAI6994708.1 hypothetical protein KC359_g4468 [Hortaea werneckii]KAI7142423.1 hypothetical protein KC344_g7213 [Hortaea werneckii]KAI7175181.1 hypothetical protein KC360_g3818 [Hortaea werneckii]